MDAQNWVAMGYVKGAFGIKGWLKVKADTEHSDSLLDYPEWRLRRDSDVRTLALESGKVAGDELQVKFVGIDDRDAAALLRGYTVEIARADFAPAAEDEYYWADLVGMSVLNRAGEDLGKVVNLMDTGAHDVLVVEGNFGQKLIPFVSHYIDGVDSENRVINADWGVDY